MKTNKFLTKSRFLMYEYQCVGWMDMFQFAFDCYDIAMWLIL